MSAVQDFLREAPILVFVVVFGIPLLLAGMFIAVGVWSARNARALRSVAPTAVSRLTGGYQMAQGRIAGDGALAAPLTDRPCAWYEVKVQEDVRKRETDGEYSYSWQTVREEASSQAIRIVDGAATCLVEPAGATVLPTEWSEWSGPEKTPANRDPERHPGDTVPGGKGRIEVHTDANRRFRYLERYIYPGDPAFALGLVQRRTGAAGGPQFSLGKPASGPFMISTQSLEKVLADSGTASRGGLIMGAAFAILAAAILVLRFS